MSKEIVQMVFRGDAVAEHAMDVEQLAPALMAVGELCREANKIINADRAKVHVLVKSDFERGSFDINFEVVQTIYDQVRGLLQDQRVATAKELLEWLGIFGIPAGVFWFLKRRKGRDIIEVVRRDDVGIVKLMIEGESDPIEVNNQVFDLSENKKILKSCKGIVAPVLTPGIDSVEFRSDEETYETINEEEAEYIIATDTGEDDEELEPQTVEAVLTILSPVFDVGSTTWRFYYGEERIKVDVSETSIPRDAMNKGSVNVADVYKVKLQITQRRTPAGRFTNDYKIVELLEFILGPEQQSLPIELSSPDTEDS